MSTIILTAILFLIVAGTHSAGVPEKRGGAYVSGPDELTVNSQVGRMKLQVVTDNIIRVLYVAGDSFPTRKSIVVLDKKRPQVKWYVKEGKESVSIVTGEIQAEVLLNTCAVTFRDLAGNPILGEPAEGGKKLTPAKIEGEEVLNAEQRFRISADEGVYGLGQFQDGVMNYRNHDVVMAQVNTKITVPFLVSTRGYGIYWDNYSLTKFHDGADGMSLWSEAADAVDYYFVYGPSMDAVIAGYRELTGAAPMFGKWAYGYWQSKERYASGKELVDVAAEYRARKLPIDNIVQDWMYWGKYGWSAMKFDEADFPEPEKTIAELHRMNFHIMISIWPKFDASSDIYKEMDSKGRMIKGQGPDAPAYYDAHSDEARDIYWKHVKKGLFSKGIDAWWMDATEPEVFGGRSPEDHAAKMKTLSRTALGSNARYLNTFPLMTTKGVYEHMREDAPEKRVFILTRSAFAGQQRNAAAAWSGDIEGEWGVLRNQISAGLNFSMAGLPYWTTDIGAFFVRYADGCKNDEYRELYTRWFQFGAFCPIFRSHGTHTPREIWRFGNPGDWAYDSLVTADNLRYRLMPYIYSLAWKVTSGGYTIMRGLPFDFGDDPETRGIDDQFMFGPAFLVNPVTVPMYNKEKLNAVAKMLKETKSEVKAKIITDWKTKSRKVYLPKAVWHDFWTGARLEGGRRIDAEAPIGIIPLYVRAGSIVPMGPKIQYATEKQADPIELRVYPGADAEFVLYEDENDNYNYEKGVFATIPLKWNDASKTLTIGDRKGGFPGMLKDRTFDIVLVGPNHGVGVEPADKPDKSVKYSGASVSVEL